MNKLKLASSLASIALAGTLGLATSAALADSISPDTYTANLGIGDSVTINKTVTVDAGTLTTGLVDVFFLVDTSGSMGTVINAVKSNAIAILSGTAGFGDVAWGVGSYEDFPTSPFGGSADSSWRLNQTITTVQGDVQTGINSLALGFGGDLPESNLEALFQTATNATVGWRDGSTRFVVWFGDDRGHDPLSCADQGFSGCTNPATAGYLGATLTATIAALDSQGIEVIGVNRLAGTTGTGIDGTGQATTIINEVGGQLLSLAGDPAGGIVNTIQDALESAFATYSSVTLSPVGNMPGVDVNWVPLFDTDEGPWTREITRTFDFTVTFTALEVGTHDFVINALVDRAIVATERDSIIVGEATAVPEPGTIALVLAGLGLVGGFARRRQNA